MYYCFPEAFHLWPKQMTNQEQFSSNATEHQVPTTRESSG